LDEAKTFDVSVQKIGQAEPLKVEFKKIDVEDWNRRLAWAAWILFAVSFFLPAYADGRGWKCAGLSATAVSWSNFSLRNWFDVHLASLTLANLMMIVSPFLLARLLRTANSLKWLRLSTFAALVLVWSFLLLLIADGGRTDLKIGCYVWAASFLLLFLSTLKSRNQETEMQKEQYV